MLEYNLVVQFGWSLYDIDQTDILSLIPFVFYAGHMKAEQAKTQQAPGGPRRLIKFADEVDL